MFPRLAVLNNAVEKFPRKPFAKGLPEPVGDLLRILRCLVKREDGYLFHISPAFSHVFAGLSPQLGSAIILPESDYLVLLQACMTNRDQKA